MIGVYGVEEREGRDVAVFFDKLERPLVERDVFVLISVQAIVNSLGIVRRDEGAPVPIEGRLDAGDIVLKDFEHGREIAVFVGFDRRKFVIVYLPAIVDHAVDLRTGAGQMTGIVGQRDGGHNVPRFHGGRSGRYECVDIWRMCLLEGIHADTIEGDDQDAFGLNTFQPRGLSQNRYSGRKGSLQSYSCSDTSF